MKSMRVLFATLGFLFSTVAVLVAQSYKVPRHVALSLCMLGGLAASSFLASVLGELGEIDGPEGEDES